MTRRPRRQILSNLFAYDCVNYSADDTKFAVRILKPISNLGKNNEEALSKVEPSLIQLLHSTIQLAYQDEESSENSIEYVFDIDGTRYYVAMEAILDKTTRMFKNWQPMANFLCVVNKQERYLQFIESARLTNLTHYKSNEFAWANRYSIVGQIFCRDETDKPKDCAMSFVSKPKGKIITTIEYDEPTSADFVNNNRNASRYLNILPKLTAPETCKPNELVTIKVQFWDGDFKQKITDVNWDGLVITPIDGYAPKKRCVIRNGAGEFKVRALDLVKGDKMRIKVGTQFYLDKAECTIKII